MLEGALMLPGNVLELVKILVIVIGAFLADWFVSRYLRSIARILGIGIETLKGLRFFFRFIIIAIVLIAFASVKWFPSEYFVGAGAIIGTVIGFASASAISNFLSGAYILVSRVIRIGDFVRIDNYEGVVVDMSVNYTKIRTVDGNIVYISNRDISNKNIISYRFEKDGEEYYVYPVRFSLDKNIGIDKVYNVFEEIKQKYEKELIDISLKTMNISRLEIEYTITITTRDADILLALKPKIIEDIAKNLFSSR